MPKVYHGRDWALLVGDCNELLPRLPARAFDAVITDPDYQIAGGGKRIQRGGSAAPLELGELLEESASSFAWVREVSRLLVVGGALISFCDAKEVSDLWRAVELAGIHPLQVVGWKKPNAGPNPRKNFTSAIELGVFGRRPGRVRWWAGGATTPNVLDAPIVTGPERPDHPTPKPPPLIRVWTRVVVPPAGIVLDPFAGSGNHGRAALLEGRCYLGIERSPRYARGAAEELADCERQIQIAAAGRRKRRHTSTAALRAAREIGADGQRELELELEEVAGDEDLLERRAPATVASLDL